MSARLVEGLLPALEPSDADAGPGSVRARLTRTGPPPSTTVLKLCMIALGVSAFPVCETLLLQTTMFATCFRWGDRFYGGSTLALFLPGFAVQVLQNRGDAAAELLVGSRQFALVRLVVGHAVQLVALAVFFALLHDDPRRWEGDDTFMALAFIVIGCSCAIVYGTCAQTVSLFPSEVHPYFFVGTYSVSWAIAPLNIATGQLCDEGSATPHWDRVVVYYSAGSTFQILGLVAFIVLAYTHVGGGAFSRKDHLLERAAVATPRRKKVAPAAFERKDNEKGWIVPTSDGKVPGGGEQLPQVDRPSRAAVSPAEARHSLVYIWRKCLYVAAAMVISLLENLLVCGLFARLRVQGDIPNLRTTMFYSFYISQCFGTIVVMVPVVERLLTANCVMVITIIRLPFLVAIFIYNQQTGRSLLFQSDLEVAGVYSVYMFLGGMVRHAPTTIQFLAPVSERLLGFSGLQ